MCPDQFQPLNISLKKYLKNISLEKYFKEDPRGRNGRIRIVKMTIITKFTDSVQFHSKPVQYNS